MIEIDAVVIRIEAIIQYGIMRTLRQLLQSGNISRFAVLINIGDLTRISGSTAGRDIGQSRTSAVYIPGTLDLIGSGRTAP